jgi:hypothetical protein
MIVFEWVIQGFFFGIGISASTAVITALTTRAQQWYSQHKKESS